jgi:acyl-CoA synthetase (AMP-forming)/AMP-acid ligase II
LARRVQAVSAHLRQLGIGREEGVLLMHDCSDWPVAFLGGETKSGNKYVHNADGTCTHSGRRNDRRKVSGIYVSPFEIEAPLVQHPAVLEAAVIGKDDEDGLRKTRAFVVLKADQQTSEAELKAFVKDRLAACKYTRYIEFVGELPKTAIGKIQRFSLREREREREGSGSGTVLRVEAAVGQKWPPVSRGPWRPPGTPVVIT